MCLLYILFSDGLQVFTDVNKKVVYALGELRFVHVQECS